MLERFLVISSHHNVSGSEGQMRSFLQTELEKCGLKPIVDETDCIYTLKQGTNPKRTVLICVPMDLPGYLALSVSGDKSVLVPTATFPFSLENGVTLLDESNHQHKAKPIQVGESELTIQSDGIQLADTFRLFPDLKGKSNTISGYFAANYALIALLLELCACQTQNNVVFLFTQGGATDAAKEKNIIRRIQPDLTVFLSSMKSKEKAPCVLIKDAKSFSSTPLTSEFLSLANEKKLAISQIVSTSAISKAQQVFSFEPIPFLSLSLPHSRSKNGKQTINLKVLETLFVLLQTWL